MVSNEQQQTPVLFTLAAQQWRQFAFTWLCNFDACHSNVFCGHNSSSVGARDWSFVQQASVAVRSCFQFSPLSRCRSFRCSLPINRLTPNDPYMGHTAPLTSKRCIIYIQGLSKRFEHLLLWPPRSLDLTPCDFFLWGYVKDNAYKSQTARSHSSCGENHWWEQVS